MKVRGILHLNPLLNEFNPNSETGVDGIAQRLDAQGFAPTKAVLNCNTAKEAQSPERQSAAARPPLQLRSSGSILR